MIAGVDLAGQQKRALELLSRVIPYERWAIGRSAEDIRLREFVIACLRKIAGLK